MLNRCGLSLCAYMSKLPINYTHNKANKLLNNNNNNNNLIDEHITIDIMSILNMIVNQNYF
jgi:Ca2+-binding EF-hand superfamily protein